MILISIWICFESFKYFTKSAGEYELTANEDTELEEEEGDIVAQVNNINPQHKYYKSTLEVIQTLSDIVNSIVFIMYIEHFTGYTQYSNGYIVCSILLAIKIILWTAYLINNMLISYSLISDRFVEYFTFTLGVIQYHFCLMDGMFRLIYAFPNDWTMKPAIFWSVTYSLTSAALNFTFLSITYDLKEISSIKDKIFKYYNVSTWDNFYFTMKLKGIVYFAKFLVFIPIFLVVNTITCGLSIVIIFTKSNLYTIFFALMWIFGMCMIWMFRKCKLNFFADLTIFILFMNFVEMINVSVITATIWLYGHYDLPKISAFFNTDDGNLIPDHNYYYYTLSAWIIYIVGFIVLFKYIKLIYKYMCCPGYKSPDSICCDAFVYILAYPLAFFIGVGIYIQPLLVSLCLISAMLNLMVFGGTLCRILDNNMREICALLLVIVVVGIVSAIVFAFF